MGVVGKGVDVMFSSFCCRGRDEVRSECREPIARLSLFYSNGRFFFCQIGVSIVCCVEIQINHIDR